MIGKLGYRGSRQFGETQVVRFDTDTFRCETLNPTGATPGWISGHRAIHVSSSEIRVTGGNVADHDGQKETLLPNSEAFILDTGKFVWRPA